MIRVVIVDDHALFRLGIKSALTAEYPNMAVIGEAGSGESLFGLLQTTVADIILLDILLPGISGIAIARRLRMEYPHIKILAVSVEDAPDTVKALIDIGIDGFISKRQSSAQELAKAIVSIMDGFEYFGKDIAAIVYNIYVSKKDNNETAIELTEREKEIITLCRDGLIGKEIASRLNISPRTVDTHKTNIFRKVGINTTLEMVQYALKQGIISLE